MQSFVPSNALILVTVVKLLYSPYLTRAFTMRTESTSALASLTDRKATIPTVDGKFLVAAVFQAPANTSESVRKHRPNRFRMFKSHNRRKTNPFRIFPLIRSNSSSKLWVNSVSRRGKGDDITRRMEDIQGRCGEIGTDSENRVPSSPLHPALVQIMPTISSERNSSLETNRRIQLKTSTIINRKNRHDIETNELIDFHEIEAVNPKLADYSKTNQPNAKTKVTSMKIWPGKNTESSVVNRQKGTGVKMTKNRTISSIDETGLTATIPQLLIIEIPPQIEDDNGQPLFTLNTPVLDDFYANNRNGNINKSFKNISSNGNFARTSAIETYDHHSNFQRTNSLVRNNNIIPVFHVANYSITLLGTMNKATKVINVKSRYDHRSPLSVYIVKRIDNAKLTTNNDRHWNPSKKYSPEELKTIPKKYSTFDNDPARIIESTFTTKVTPIKINNEKPLDFSELNFDSLLLPNILNTLLNIKTSTQRDIPNPNANEMYDSTIRFENNTGDLFSVYFLTKNTKMHLGTFNRTSVNKFLKKVPSSVFLSLNLKDSKTKRIMNDLKDMKIFMPSFNKYQDPRKNITCNKINNANGRPYSGISQDEESSLLYNGRTYLELMKHVSPIPINLGTRFNGKPKSFLENMAKTTLSLGLINEISKQYPKLQLLRKMPQPYTMPPNPYQFVTNGPANIIIPLLNNGKSFKSIQKKSSNILTMNDDFRKKISTFHDGNLRNKLNIQINGISYPHRKHSIILTERTTSEFLKNTDRVPCLPQSGHRFSKAKNNEKSECENHPSNQLFVFYYSESSLLHSTNETLENKNERCSVQTNNEKHSSSNLSKDNIVSDCDQSTVLFDFETINGSACQNSDQFYTQKRRQVLRVNENQEEHSTESHKFSSKISKTESIINYFDAVANKTWEPEGFGQNVINQSIPNIKTPTLSSLSSQKSTPSTPGDDQKHEIKPKPSLDLAAALDKYCPSKTIKYPYMLYLLPGTKINSTETLNVNHGNKYFVQDFTTIENPGFLEDALATTIRTIIEKSKSNVTAKHVIQSRMVCDNFELPASLDTAKNDLCRKSAKNANYKLSHRTIIESNQKTVEEIMRECDEFAIVCRENELVPILNRLSRPKILTPAHVSSSKPPSNTPLSRSDVYHYIFYPQSQHKASNQFSLPRYDHQSDFSPFESGSRSVDKNPLSPVPETLLQKRVPITEYPNTFSVDSTPSEKSVNFKYHTPTLKSFRLQDLPPTCVHFQNKKTSSVVLRDKLLSTPPNYVDKIKKSEKPVIDLERTSEATFFTSTKETVFSSPSLIKKCSRHILVMPKKNQTPPSRMTTPSPFKSTSLSAKHIHQGMVRSPSLANHIALTMTDVSTENSLCEHQQAEIKKDFQPHEPKREGINYSSGNGKWKIRNSQFRKNHKKIKKKKRKEKDTKRNRATEVAGEIVTAN